MKKILFKALVALLISSTVFAADHAARGTQIRVRPAAEPGATFDSIWVDYDVLQDNLRGMKVHPSFSASNMKDMGA